MLGPGPDTSNKTTTGQSTIFAITAAGPGTSSTQRSAKTRRSIVSSTPPPTDTSNHFHSRRMENSRTVANAHMTTDVNAL